jgi:hypothetical protein
MKIRPVGPELFHADRQTHDEFFSFLTKECTFYFRISVQFTLHMFRPLLCHHQGYIDKFTSLFTGPFGTIIDNMFGELNKIQNSLVKILKIYVTMHGEHDVKDKTKLIVAFRSFANAPKNTNTLCG